MPFDCENANPEQNGGGGSTDEGGLGSKEYETKIVQNKKMKFPKVSPEQKAMYKFAGRVKQKARCALGYCPPVSLFQISFVDLGRDPLSSGYGRRLMSQRL